MTGSVLSSKQSVIIFSALVRQFFERVFCGHLLGFLLAAARAFAHGAAVEQNFEIERLVMVGAALTKQAVGKRLVRRALHEFL